MDALPSMEVLLGQHVDLTSVRKIGEGTFGEAFAAGGLVLKVICALYPACVLTYEVVQCIHLVTPSLSCGWREHIGETHSYVTRNQRLYVHGKHVQCMTLKCHMQHVLLPTTTFRCLSFAIRTKPTASTCPCADCADGGRYAGER